MHIQQNPGTDTPLPKAATREDHLTISLPSTTKHLDNSNTLQGPPTPLSPPPLSSFPPLPHQHLPPPASSSFRRKGEKKEKMSALFNFHSLLLVLLLLICNSAYIHDFYPGYMDRRKDGVLGIFWKFARIGERLSPWVSVALVAMAVCLPFSSFFTPLPLFCPSLLL